MKQQTTRTLAACVAVFIGGAALAEDRTTGAIKPLSSVKFSPDNDVKCLQSAIERGDPTTVSSTLSFKTSPGSVGPGAFDPFEDQFAHAPWPQWKSRLPTHPCTRRNIISVLPLRRSHP